MLAVANTRTLYQVVSDFGLPKILQSDNGTEFINTVIKALKTLSGFEHQFILAYHPQANGAAESHVKLARNTLNKLVNSDWSHWHTFLPAAQYAINQRVTHRHKFSPFQLFFGHPATTPQDYSSSSSQLPTKTLLLKNAKQMHNIVYPASASSTRKHSSNIKAQHDSSKPLHEFTAGSKVMLRKPPRSPKSLPEYSGPFTVIHHNHGGAYLLQDSTGVTLLDKFSPNQLKLVAPPGDSTNELPPDEYEIDEILDHKGPANKCEYFVHWKGYPHSDNQWIPAKDVHAPKLIKRYWDLLKQSSSSSTSS